MTSRLRSGVVLAFALLCFTPSSASATPSTEDAALAETLFVEGKRRMEANELESGCRMLALSHAIDPGGGTAVALGLCLEREGKTASAWAQFEEALTIALRDANEERAAVAKEHRDALAAKLSRVRVRLNDEAAQEHITILRDGKVLPREAWPLSIPIDPGLHTFELRSRSGVRARVDVEVLPGPSERIVVLDAARVAADEAQEGRAGSGPRPGERGTPDSSGDPDGSGSIGWFVAASAVGTLSIASFAVAAASAVEASSLAATADARCPNPRCDDPLAVERSARAGTWADVATATLVSGAVGLAGAAALVAIPLVVEDDADVSVAIAPASSGIGVALRGRY